MLAVVLIQGWMRHMNRCVPAASEPLVTLAPGPAPVVAKMPGMPHSGIGLSPSGPFSSATQPPPKAATGVNVWNSPPRLVAVTVPPASTFS